MLRATRFGTRLPDGGTIGVIAPSGPYFNRSEVLRGVAWWESHGYRVKLAEGIYSRDDYVAGDPKSRARDLVSMFADPDVDVIQMLHGGYGAAETIPFIDFESIAEHPKALVGFSDVTVLHVALLTFTGLAGVHANGLHGMGSPTVTEFSKSRLLSVLREGGAGEVPRDPDDPYVRAIRGGKATGPLVGGNLHLLVRTLGTPYEVDLDGAIFLWEAVDEPVWVLDGDLTQLAHAGKLDGVAGVVVSELVNCDWREERPETPRTKSVEDLLEEKLDPLGVPVLYKLPLGHGKHLAATPLGVMATLDADAGTLTLEEPGLR